jgi:hypothetical protein
MDGFLTIYNDLKNDLRITFPELKDKLNDLSDNEVYEHCMTIFPSHFFDILYEKMSLFDEEIYLLPTIDFSLLMKDETMSDKTRTTLWKYLQLILFYIVEKNNPLEDSVHKKMDETMDNMKHMFQQSDISNSFHNMFQQSDISNHAFDDLSNNPIMNGKIGSIAREIAQETASEFGNQEDFMSSMMKDPSKIMALVQNIGSKLEDKLKSNDLKDDDMMKEASEIMNQLPGLKDMMKNMDMKGMMNKMEQETKKNATKERMRNKMEQNKMEQNKMGQNKMGQNLEQTAEGDFVFKKGDAPKKSKRKQKKK